MQSLTTSSLPPAGLKAATRFVELHSTLLEQLDVSKVLHFGPLQEVVLDKLGMTADSFPNADVTLTDFLKQAVADDVRLFIWALEEHREDFAPCHSLLDYYFDMMGMCILPPHRSSMECVFCSFLNHKKTFFSDVQYSVLKKDSESDLVSIVKHFITIPHQSGMWRITQTVPKN